MGHLAAAGKDVLGIDRDDRTAVITHDLLQLPVHGAAAVGIELGAGLNQQGVEAFVLPVRIVPGGIGRVGGSEHQVLGGSAAPETGAKRLLQPDIRPVAVIRLAHYLDLDAGLGSRLAEQHRGVDGLRKRGIGGVELHRQAVEPSLFQVIPRLFRIIFALRHLGVKIAVGRRDRAVVSGLSETSEQELDKLLAVDGVFEGQTHIDIVEGRNIREHRHAEMLRPGHGVDGDPGLPFQKMHGAEIDAADAVGLAGEEGGRPGRLIAERQLLHPIEMGAPFLPVVRVALTDIAHTRLELGQLVAAGRNPRLPVAAAVLGRKDDEEILRNDIGKICIPALQLKHHGAVIRLADIGHPLQKRFAGSTWCPRRDGG